VETVMLAPLCTVRCAVAHAMRIADPRTRHVRLVIIVVLALAIALISRSSRRARCSPARDRRPPPPPPTPRRSRAALDDPLAGPDAEASEDPPRRRPRATASADDLPANTPPLTAVLTAAYDTAGLARGPVAQLIPPRPAVRPHPVAHVRTTRDTSWQDDQSEVGHGTTLELRATWRLDRLLFDGRELQVATIEAARHRERRRLATRVIRAYFAWRRAAVAAPAPTSAPRRASLSQPLS